MRAIQQQLSHPRHTEVQRIFVKAPPKEAWETARHFDMGTIGWVRLLFDIRLLPDRLWGLQPAEADRRLGVDQVTGSDTGFMIVHETPARQVTQPPGIYLQRLGNGILHAKISNAGLISRGKGVRKQGGGYKGHTFLFMV
jgi:hypothetical protein